MVAVAKLILKCRSRQFSFVTAINNNKQAAVSKEHSEQTRNHENLMNKLT